jgi:hypothetical protein
MGMGLKRKCMLTRSNTEIFVFDFWANRRNDKYYEYIDEGLIYV